LIYNSKMNPFSGEAKDKHFGNNIPLHQSEQGQQQQLHQQLKAFEEANRISGNKISFHVNTYNDPLVALSEFKPDFYDLMLVDINMPRMNGFNFCAKVLEIDINPRVCFMSSGLINQEALSELYPSLSFGCFIRKPVTIENLE
jgi:DNA-binding response OmpR family regulator